MTSCVEVIFCVHKLIYVYFIYKFVLTVKYNVEICYN